MKSVSPMGKTLWQNQLETADQGNIPTLPLTCGAPQVLDVTMSASAQGNFETTCRRAGNTALKDQASHFSL